METKSLENKREKILRGNERKKLKNRIIEHFCFG